MGAVELVKEVGGFGKLRDALNGSGAFELMYKVVEGEELRLEIVGRKLTSVRVSGGEVWREQNFDAGVDIFVVGKDGELVFMNRTFLGRYYHVPMVERLPRKGVDWEIENKVVDLVVRPNIAFSKRYGLKGKVWAGGRYFD